MIVSSRSSSLAMTMQSELVNLVHCQHLSFPAPSIPPKPPDPPDPPDSWRPYTEPLQVLFMCIAVDGCSLLPRLHLTVRFQHRVHQRPALVMSKPHVHFSVPFDLLFDDLYLCSGKETNAIALAVNSLVGNSSPASLSSFSISTNDRTSFASWAWFEWILGFAHNSFIGPLQPSTTQNLMCSSQGINFCYFVFESLVLSIDLQSNNLVSFQLLNLVRLKFYGFSNSVISEKFSGFFKNLANFFQWKKPISITFPFGKKTIPSIFLSGREKLNSASKPGPHLQNHDGK